MDWRNGWQVFFLLSNVLSDASAAFVFIQELRKWLQLKKGGTVTSFKIHRPLVILLLVAIVTGGACIWIAFHPRTGEKIQAQATSQQSASASSPHTPAPEIQKPHTSPDSSPTKESKPKPAVDPCPYGYTILRDVTAVKSKWDHATTTGFNFKNGVPPCTKIIGAKSIDNDIGFNVQGSQVPPQVTVNCDHNAANCAAINNGTQQTNYGVSQPPPQIVGLSLTAIDPLPPPKPPSTAIEGSISLHPGAEARFTVANDFPNAEFLLNCDRPCELTTIFVSADGVQSPREYKLSSVSWLAEIGLMGVLHPQEVVFLRVRSQDESKVAITSVRSYVAPIQRWNL